MLVAGWTVLLSFLLTFILCRRNPQNRRWVFGFGALTTTLIYMQFQVFTTTKDLLLFAMIFHIPLFFAYSVAFWCHTNLPKSILETLAAYLVVSLLYLLLKDHSLLSLGLILLAIAAQWLITTTYFQMHPDDFVYDDTR